MPGSNAAIIADYFNSANVMQLGTIHGGEPRVCSVYYVSDANHNLYWLSWPSRNHSHDIAQNPHVAAAIAIRLGHPVVGIQLTGTATVVADAKEVAAVMPAYIARHNKGHTFYDNFIVGTNKHSLYRLTPNTIEAFDQERFGDYPEVLWSDAG